MAVRIRLKKLGRRHRPFFRVCAMDSRTPRNGTVIEELGYYDPMVRDTDARAILNGERIDHWLGVGALPTEKVSVLIKKYGTNGTHLEQQKQALERLNQKQAFVPMVVPVKEIEKEEPPAPEPAAEATIAPGEATEEPAAQAEAQEKPAEESSE